MQANQRTTIRHLPVALVVSSPFIKVLILDP